jgi:hypothetical protein
LAPGLLGGQTGQMGDFDFANSGAPIGSVEIMSARQNRAGVSRNLALRIHPRS